MADDNEWERVDARKAITRTRSTFDEPNKALTFSSRSQLHWKKKKTKRRSRTFAADEKRLDPVDAPTNRRLTGR